MPSNRDTTRSAARNRRTWPTWRRRWRRCTRSGWPWPSARTSRRRSRRKILTFLELAPYFRAIVGPDLAGARKPDAQHVLRTLEATDCAAADALFVGDMPIDVHAARNSGMDVAVVPTGSSTAEALQASKPDHYLER